MTTPGQGYNMRPRMPIVTKTSSQTCAMVQNPCWHWRIQKSLVGDVVEPSAARGVGCGEWVSPLPTGGGVWGVGCLTGSRLKIAWVELSRVGQLGQALRRRQSSECRSHVLRHGHLAVGGVNDVMTCSMDRARWQMMHSALIYTVMYFTLRW